MYVDSKKVRMLEKERRSDPMRGTQEPHALTLQAPVRGARPHVSGADLVGAAWKPVPGMSYLRTVNVPVKHADAWPRPGPWSARSLGICIL